MDIVNRIVANSDDIGKRINDKLKEYSIDFAYVGYCKVNYSRKCLETQATVLSSVLREMRYYRWKDDSIIDRPCADLIVQKLYEHWVHSVKVFGTKHAECEPLYGILVDSGFPEGWIAWDTLKGSRLYC